MTVQELYERIGGSYEDAKRTMMMDKLIDKMIRKLPDDKSFDRLRDGWAGRDPAGTFEGAHALKGVCANLGLTALSQEASALAEEFRPGNPRKMEDAEIDRRLESLKEGYTRAVEEIRAYASA